MNLLLNKIISKFAIFLIFGLMVFNAHAQLWFYCAEGPEGTEIASQEVTNSGNVNIPLGYELWTEVGDVVIYSMKPGSATTASWRLTKMDQGGIYQTVMTGGTVSNTLIYTAVANEPVPSPIVDSINGTATLSRRCIPAKDVAPALGIPTLSQWGLFGTGLLLTLAAAFHFRPRRRRPQ